ncbi:type VI secretion system baseplate subunit TssG [Pseudoalteromonas ulvae]|uniref:Type VI secretion protein n=1 Tax=Pseudoalteromonas ulvae TaxID=107327 RepID=A0A244CRD7_PSEDV|nr:type VI secretion system baseplate subunit TssG [Pseudoalteromonas ulvae]OUL58193.1 hypothetical protein B1199_07515 [Pseudoalteromonas ulvae]
MANANGLTVIERETQLIEHASRYSFIQAYKQLCELATVQKHDAAKKVRIRPNLAMSYARSEVVAIVKEMQNESEFIYFLEVNLMGLYGQNSPLPKFFTEEIIQAQKKELHASRIFIDVIHQRLYQLYFEAKTKYSGHLQQSVQHQLYEFMFSMIGFKGEQWLRYFPDPAFIINNINLFRHQKGTVSGLKSLLSRLFDNATVEIKQCQQRTLLLPIVQRSQLGVDSLSLGGCALLGHKLKEKQSKLLIVISPLSEKQFDHWVNHDQHWQSLQYLIRYFLIQPFVVELRIKTENSRNYELSLSNSKNIQLGRNTWLSAKEEQVLIEAQLRLQ